jgi:hypothetical protein
MVGKPHPGDLVHDLFAPDNPGPMVQLLTALTSADVIPIAREELASSPSSSEMSMAKENKLSGESCS